MTDTLITARKSPYNKENHLSLLERINPEYGIDILVEQLKTEKWMLYDVVINEKLIGIFVVRIEKQINDTIELVVLHTVSVLRQDIPFVVIVEPLIDEIAKLSKCKYIRIYADKPTICKLIEKHTNNYKWTQSIYTKEIKYVQQ